MALQALRAKAPLRVLHVGRQQTELRIRQHFMDTPVEQAVLHNNPRPFERPPSR